MAVIPAPGALGGDSRGGKLGLADGAGGRHHRP
jgi:hypothetical protein